MKDKKPNAYAEIVKGSIWKTPSVTEQPVINLVSWSVWQTTDGARHLVGHNQEDREGRASTAVQSFDPFTGQATTLSGRTYQLIGRAGYDSDGHWVWGLWAKANQWTSTDITEIFEKEILAAINRRQFLRDILCTAIEGGVSCIGYWAAVSNTIRDGEEYIGCQVRDNEDPGDRSRIVDIPQIEEAIAAVTARTITIGDTYREKIMAASATNDAGAIDGDLADILVQIAAYAEIRFS